jgi:dihydrofolate reductase
LRCSIYLASSLDGFIARTDGAVDWLSRVERPGEDYGFASFFSSVDVLVMGRRSYDVVLALGIWPYGDKRVIVLTHRPETARRGEEFWHGDVRALHLRLAGEGARHVYVDGGQVLSQFLAARLIDAVTVSVIPVLLGEGTRFTQPLGTDVVLSLTGHRTYDSGLVQLSYAVTP